jgi:hypothetical protein
MTWTTPDTLTVRCLAGVLDAAGHCQHCSIGCSRCQYSTNPYAMTLARRAAQAARLPMASVQMGAKGGGDNRTDD